MVVEYVPMLSKLLVDQHDHDHEHPVIDLDALVEVSLSHVLNRLFAKARQIQRIDSNTGRYVRAECLRLRMSMTTLPKSFERRASRIHSDRVRDIRGQVSLRVEADSSLE